MSGAGVAGIRPVWAEVDLDAIGHNVREIRRHLGPEPQIMAIVKANGYGHGAPEVARVALAHGATWLGVAMVDEAEQLRAAGITAPVHLLSMPSLDQAEQVVAGGFSCALCASEIAAALSAAAVKLGKPAQVHLKIDSGMGRLGLLPEEAVTFWEAIRALPGLEVLGAFTHFAVADERDKTYTETQYRRFQGALKALRAAGAKLPLVHAANSAAIIDLPRYHETLVRPGIILYGLYPSEEVGHEVALRPAMSLKATVSFVKRLPAQASVSYGRTWFTSAPQKIALLPLGYADGYSRLLSGKAQVLLHGRRLPVVGRICMDQCAVAVPDEVPVAIGDEAVLFGRQGSAEISIDEVAGWLGTINYEVPCMISGRVPRVYLKDGSVTAVRSFLPGVAPLQGV